MDVASFCKQSHVVIVAGKGGVGKTTVAAALAQCAANAGLDALLVELEGRQNLARAFDATTVLGYEETVLDAGRDGEGEAHDPQAGEAARESSGGSSGGRVRARWLTPDDALLEYLADHGLKRISKRLVSSGALDIVATAVPGLRDILVLGKIKQLEQAGAADCIVVDAPASGHALRFLTSAKGLLEAARSGPVRKQASDVMELLQDASRCQVVLVTLPEDLPVSETVETAYHIEEQAGIALGPIIVNGCYPVLEAMKDDPSDLAAMAGETLTEEEAGRLRQAAAFRSAEQDQQSTALERLAEELPLPQICLDQIFSPSMASAEIGKLARVMEQQLSLLPEPGSEVGA